MMRGRTLGFVLLSLACAVGAGAYVYRVLQRAPSPRGDAARAPAAPRNLGAGVAVPDVSHSVLLFRNTTMDQSYGRLAIAPLDDQAERRIVPRLSCERVDYAAGRGVCLTANRGVTTTYAAIVFDQSFKPLFTLELGGIPSRVRVAPDGKVAAVSVLVSGHSYGGANFSTATSVIDLERGTYVVPNFEQLNVSSGSQPFDAVDRNFWGVTFAKNSDTFYATVASGGQSHLIEGTLSGRRAELLSEEVECPSLSPDNRRLAFKHRVGNGLGPVQWRLAVLDLETRQRVLLAETRSVDDQVAWLDDDHVMYALPASESGSAESNTWVVDADGNGAPRLLVPQAYSAVVWRDAAEGAAAPAPGAAGR
jgi:hypothetical protein